MTTFAGSMVKRIIRNPIIGSPITNAFHFLLYHSDSTWVKSTFLGYPIQQCPMDLHLYQEVVYATQPPFILQTGIALGGSLRYFAALLDLLGAPSSAIVIGIDIALTESARTLTHPRIRLLEGSSTDPQIVDRVRQFLPAATGFVVLDSDHSRDHVLAELAIYKELVSLGPCLVVEDTNINGHPVSPFWGPGPREAVNQFLRADDRFVRDDAIWRKNLFSFHQGGWLRRLR